MNLDDKLKLAHEWAMSMLAKDPRYSDATDFNIRAWQYADAMEKQYNQRKPSGLPDALIMANSPQLEFQPDWSQAPSNADSWTMRPDGKCLWWSGTPVSDGTRFTDMFGVCFTVGYAPSFNYQGDWKDSLRKRPKEQTYKCNCAHWKNSTCFMGDTFKCGDCGGIVTI